jgi:DNA-binding transcriptional ArsR family regulator
MLTGYRLKERVKPYSQRQNAVAHPIRLSILYLLAHGSMVMHDIVECLDYKENLVAHHLHILLKAGWVTKEKKGKNVVYSLKERQLFTFYRLFDDTPLYHSVISKKKLS